MPIYQLSKSLAFPDPELADGNGILAIGGDLSEERLLLAYSIGIFPWFNEGEPIMWWSPDPRLVLYPENIKISKSLRQLIRSDRYSITFDKDFSGVISNCKEVYRKGQKGTWITDEMENAYISLYKAGYAHSVEVWDGNDLIGGLYGIAIGGIFCGESMFSTISNASKLALVFLVDFLKEQKFSLIDCQVYTGHLSRLGAEEISRTRFQNELNDAIQQPDLIGPWSRIDHQWNTVKY